MRTPWRRRSRRGWRPRRCCSLAMPAGRSTVTVACWRESRIAQRRGGAIVGPSLARLEAASSAVSQGMKSVHIIGGRRQHALEGTMVLADEVRPFPGGQPPLHGLERRASCAGMRSAASEAEHGLSRFADFGAILLTLPPRVSMAESECMATMPARRSLSCRAQRGAAPGDNSANERCSAPFDTFLMPGRENLSAS